MENLTHREKFLIRSPESYEKIMLGVYYPSLPWFLKCKLRSFCGITITKCAIEAAKKELEHYEKNPNEHPGFESHKENLICWLIRHS